ncbi:Fe(3+)-hydroxamate ABC transporter permease FhuB [Ensifer soli]|uniref:Fe(3+)-hydroxamate ABC transporter permease FhuB n=1 Tax=Ciceribacter sp. sgz301302 TaxID=3342379 RepID=UPI0035B93F60
MIPTAVRFPAGPAVAVLCLVALAAVIAWSQVAPVLSVPAAAGYDIERMVLYHATLPRMATALLSGAALALSGAIFQQVLRNPLASPTTLGISAGASLSLALATLFLPALLGFSRDLVALAGSAMAAAVVMGIGARRGFSPFSLVLSGLVVGLWCGALSAVLLLMKDRYLVSLFIWGAGSLSQQSWSVPLALLPKIALLALAAVLVIRPLALVDLGDGGATALGLDVARLRFCAVTIAVALAALVTSAVGVIGFIGLVAPTIARLCGARRPGSLLLWSALTGAALLWLADGAVQVLAGSLSDFLPTGAVTAVFGSPLLLVLLPLLKVRPRVAARAFAPARRVAVDGRLLAAAALGLLAAVLVALLVGRALDGGWALPARDLMPEILALRGPKVAAALASGAMLAVAGVILQRLTGNEMASPEVLGISAGATFGVTIAVFVLAAPGLGYQIGFAGLGALTVLAVIVGFALRSGLAPERVLLAGIALGAMVDAVVGILGATGDPRAMLLMRWMSGSTYAVDAPVAIAVSLAGLILLALAVLSRRWLEILPLGPTATLALGLPLTRVRLLLFGLAGLLSAVATLSVGPLSFVGLMGPHLAREAGFTRALPQVAGAAAIGGGLMVLADWAGRSLAFPYEIPAGLVSALVGAPFLMLMLRRRA